MGTGSLKTIVVLILLSVLAFAAGSMASEGAKQALLPVGILMGVVTLLCLGKHCWVCAYAAPPILALFPLGALSKLPLMYAVAALLLVYWIIMYTLGHVKIVWHKGLALDILVFVFSVYFLFTWVRHPVTLEVFRNPTTDSDDTLVGGAEYVWCIFALLFYVFVSIVPMSINRLGNLFKPVFLISLVILICSTVIGLDDSSVNQQVAETELSEEMTGGRFSGLMRLGQTLCNFLACQYSLFSIICSPWKLGLYMFGLLGIALSGFRSGIMYVALTLFFAHICRKKIVSLLVLGGVAYAGVLLVAATGAVEGMPYGVKRIMSSVPGVEVGGSSAVDAKGSLDWRYEMWDWALDPSTGYIKDYVWGDGYGLNVQKLKRRTIAEMRGTYINSNRDFAAEGQWHSGWITAIHRTGIVGLVLLFILHVTFIVYALRVASYLSNVKNSGFIYYFILPSLSDVVTFYISAGVFKDVFSIYSGIALVKILTSLAIKDGLMPPMFQRKVYVPMMQREIEQATAAGQVPAALRA